MNLGIDLDGVVCDFASKANAHIARRLIRRELPVTKWDWYNDYGIEGRAVFRHIMSVEARRGFFADLVPLPGAIDSLLRLDSQGHSIHFLTHRPKAATADTETWLNYHDLSHLPVTVVDSPEDKTAFPCDVFLDDRPETIRAALASGAKGFVYLQPWNIMDACHSEPPLPHVFGWLGFEQRLAEMAA